MGVVSNLLSKERSAAYAAELRANYAEVRERRANRPSRVRRVALSAARRNGFQTSDPAPSPKLATRQVLLKQSIAALRKTIDWTPFLHTWEIKGGWPAILEHPKYGAAAKELVDDANRTLDALERSGDVEARAVWRIFPANSVGDDIEIYADPSRSETLATLFQLRQQNDKAGGGPNLCLADFVLPKSDGRIDWVGAFCVTAGHGVAEKAAALEAAHDDYEALMLKAVADRLAEAFAEWLHREVRTRTWGYAPDEALDSSDLIAEAYQGIRPAPGYPATPDQHRKTHAVAPAGTSKRPSAYASPNPTPCRLRRASAASTWPIRIRSTSVLARFPPTSSKTTLHERAGRSTKRPATSPPFSQMTRSLRAAPPPNALVDSATGAPYPRPVLRP